MVGAEADASQSGWVAPIGGVAAVVVLVWAVIRRASSGQRRMLDMPVIHLGFRDYPGGVVSRVEEVGR